MSDATEVPEGPIVPPDEDFGLSAGAKALRDRFVKEYLNDYDAVAAAGRIGYARQFAREYSYRFMQEPYVLQQIKNAETSIEDGESDEAMKKRIMTGLIREANYRGPGCSQSARVAALSKLASIAGMDAPTRSKLEMTGPDGQPIGGGVFVVPGIITMEEWEKKAAEQQAALVGSGSAAIPNSVAID